jgi:ribosome-associated protein
MAKTKKASAQAAKKRSPKTKVPVTKASKVKKKAKKKKDSPDNAISEKLCSAVVAGMQEKKAADIVIIDLRNLKNAIADFFVVCSGNSDKQLEAISDSVDEVVSKTMHENPWHSEGKNNKEWMLLDYITVVAHIFKKDRRQFYGLEKLWGDAEITEIAD